MSAAPTPSPEFFAARCEEAVREGSQLLDWIRRTDIDSISFPLDLGKKFRLTHRSRGYYGSLTLNGQPASVMGCRQVIEFGNAPRPATRRDVADFMAVEFMPRAHWTYADGFPGGFTVTQTVHKTADGKVATFPPAEQTGCIDWRRLGKEFEWVLLTLNIHDFVMDFGPFRKRMKEAACVAPNGQFMDERERPAPGIAYEFRIGYPFVRFAPIPNFFGFGPGKFGAAIKLYTMRLTEDGRVGMELDFAAAPRCQKVFDFGESIPDPVYGGARVLEKLTGGLWKAQPLRDKMDAGMLAQHCRVHQALIDGVEPIWREWLEARNAK